MAKSKADKRKAKSKAKRKTRQNNLVSNQRKGKAAYFFSEAQWFAKEEEHEKSLTCLLKALRSDPDNTDMLKFLSWIAFELKRDDLQIKALRGLHAAGELPPDRLPGFCHLMMQHKKYDEVLTLVDAFLEGIHGLRLKGRVRLTKSLIQVREICQVYLREPSETLTGQAARAKPEPAAAPKTPDISAAAPSHKAAAEDISPLPGTSDRIPEIRMSIQMDDDNFSRALLAGRFAKPEAYDLVLDAHEIRFKDAFENLICLTELHNVQSFWYQEETAKKVLKTFRGRALLADEVGLGKTIEAGMVLKEYIQREMVKNALILTPTPLVSQWRDELRSKFGLQVPSTDDPDFRSGGGAFWDQPMILASINLAKSKKNFSKVTEREWDLVIVDEAHHLKNRSTLNWQLVNALKKQFLLLLTATPVENNLMELYNLITLLKPGQLKTATAFRKEFMTRGDPTDPRNRTRLKDLLNQVMIRNTRALARINLPPRFAHTVRVEPRPIEKEVYQRVSELVRDINETDGVGSRLLLKNLLAEAGSSPRAVCRTLTGMLAKKELTDAQQKEIRAIERLGRTMGDTGKNKVLLDLLRSNTGKKIIFVNYLATLDHLSDLLSWHRVDHALFHGRMDNHQKNEQIESFQGQKDVLVSTELGGEGHNLQFCHQMINYDLPWNPMKIEQRIGRLHRIGQTREVTVSNLCGAGTVEDYILEILDRKINMFEMVIGEIDMILGRIRGEKDFSDMVYDIWVSSPSDQDKGREFDRLAAQLKRGKTRYETTRALDEKLFGENYEL